MAAVNVLNVEVLNPTAKFTDPIRLQVKFECVSELSDDLDWRLVYVGSARDPTRDQELDSVQVGPVPLGVAQFVLEAPAPDPAKIPAEDLLGATALMLTCCYKGREFTRVGACWRGRPAWRLLLPSLGRRLITVVSCAVCLVGADIRSCPTRQLAGFWVSNTYAKPLAEGSCSTRRSARPSAFGPLARPRPSQRLRLAPPPRLTL